MNRWKHDCPHYACQDAPCTVRLDFIPPERSPGRSWDADEEPDVETPARRGRRPR